MDLCFASFLRYKSDYQMLERRRGWLERERKRESGGQQKDALGTVPILLVKLQHHVVRGDA